MDDGTRPQRRRQHQGREIRESAVAGLLSLRRRGLLTAAHVEGVATGLGVTGRSVWRWLSSADKEGRLARKPRPHFELNDADVSDLAYHFGNVAALHRERLQAGAEGPSLATVRRAVARQLSPGQRAGLSKGERARRDHDTYLTRKAGFRNECWEADHTELALRAQLPDGSLVRPWLTMFVDRSTRAIPGWAMAVTASQASVLEALRSAILLDKTGEPFGGVPLRLRYDRGKEFLAEAVVAAAASLGIDARPVRAYSPHLKGVVERANETIEVLFLAELPGFAHGPKDRRGHLVEVDLPPLPFETVVSFFAEFVGRYHRRPHEGLDGASPLERWCADATPLEVLAPERLRHLLLARAERTVTKRGISLEGRTYNCAELCGYVGETVEVRYLPRHHRSIEVFRHGAHLGTAQAADELDPLEAKRLLRRRAEEARWLADRQRSAARRRRKAYALLTGEGIVRSAAGETEQGTAVERRRLGDDALSALANRSLVDHGAIPAHMVRPEPKGRAR